VAIGLCALAWLLALSLTVYGTWLSLREVGRPTRHEDVPFALFPVSILKPLKGIESGIKECLESFFQLDYPEYELIFSVADPRDPACAVVAALITQQVEIGPNPKINNMVTSYEGAQYDWILISDSNVKVKPDYLKKQISDFDADVGLITGVVSGRDANGFGGNLEATYLNTFYARWMFVAARLGKPCVVGKSMLFRRSVANRFGGIRVLARYLAEDFMAGEAMRRLGLKVLIATDPIHQHIGNYSFHSFWSRHIRWGRIRKAQAPLAFLIEPFISVWISGILGAVASHALLGFSYSAFMGLHLALWSGCDLLLMRKLDPGTSWRAPLYWLGRELLSLPLWVHTALGNTVNWRGNRLRILSGGILEAHGKS
jgi:ceramide glucosyltransferase